ncbi:transposase [Gelria sp. Kuro-4]|uniref:REP-associated tyrosine transposase n=1 Tax=Gelria sp. Kuro-4 TaxID=2796927 RepID=UPI001BEFEDFD|nr:transposase [Gelria sp. Kuro-4]BCV23997.1 transposase [Gelria sp. Kuro-4]
MARQPRIHVPNTYYHVTARGNNKEKVFLSTSDYERYLKCLGEYKERFDFHILAYALMPNHVHFLFHIGEVPLSHIMHGLQVSYTQYFNRKYERVGHVFQGRYFARLIDSDSYLLQAVRYINQNPLRAGIVPNLAAYKWCSHTEMLAKRASLVDREKVLRWFAEDPRKALQLYCRFMAVRVEEEPKWPQPSVLRQAQALGRREEEQSASPVEAGGRFNPENRPPLSRLLAAVAWHYGLTPAQLCSQQRWRDYVEARAVFSYLATRLYLYSYREVACMLAKSPTHVGNAAHRIDEVKREGKWPATIAAIQRQVEDLSGLQSEG